MSSNLSTFLGPSPANISADFVTVNAATSAATPSTLMSRDSNGNTQIATPVSSGQAATKGYVDTAVSLAFLTTSYQASASFSPLVNVVYFCNTTINSITANLIHAASAAGGLVYLKNIGNALLTVTPESGETIEFNSAGVSVILNPGDLLIIGPCTSGGFTGWFIAG